MPDIYLYDDEFILTGSRTNSIILADPTTLWSTGGGTAWTLNLADTVTMSDALVKAVGKFVADATGAVVDALVKAVGKPLSDTTTSSDAVVKSYGKFTSDNVTPSDALVKAVGKAPADTATISDAPAKAVGKAAADVATMTDQFSRTVTYARALGDTVTMSDLASLTFSGSGTSIVYRPLDLSHFDVWSTGIGTTFGIY